MERQDRDGELQGQAANVLSATSSINKTPDEIKNRMDQLSGIVYFGFIVLIFMVAQMLIDSFRTSSVIYREYEREVEALREVKEENVKIQNEYFESQKTLMVQQEDILRALENISE